MRFTAEVCCNEPITPSVRRLTLIRPGHAEPFYAGQYLALVIDEVSYPFSIANAPETNLLELHIAATPNSAESDRIEQYLNADPATLDIEYPLGSCYLAALPNKPVILIAAATGITQMKSLLDWLTSASFAEQIYLYWGVRTPDDLYIDAVFKEQANLGALHYVPVVSEPDAQWCGREGLVGEAVSQDLKQLNDYQIFVSGSPAMVYGTLDHFISQGFDPAQMRSDVFDYAPR